MIADIHTDGQTPRWGLQSYLGIGFIVNLSFSHRIQEGDRSTIYISLDFLPWGPNQLLVDVG